MNNFPLETDVRVQVDERLKNLGWELNGKNQNVFFEQPKTENEKKKLKGKRPDYVLYEKGKDTPLIIIETKKKGANINSALEQGKIYAETLNAPIVFATDGVYYKSLHTNSLKPLLLNGEEVDELIRELIAIKYLQVGTNELDTIPKQIQLSRQELINIFDEANNTLRVEGLRAGIERFSEFSNILFLKLFSEIDNLKEKPEFDRKHKWEFYKDKPSDEILDYINGIVLPQISKHYNDDNIFSSLQIKDGRVLKSIIDKLDPLVLTDINSDIKGDAFEYFLRATTATGNDLGEYFTPRHIVKMMVKLINPQIGEKIYDPFCGTGGLLIESFRHIYNTMPRNERTLKQLRENTIFGNEITNTARITKMNMILAGDGHSNIQMKNSLANPVNEKYDIVVTNMPYSQTTEYGSLYDIPTKNGDSICVQHCIKAIDKTAENGRLAIVVPEGFLFRKDLAKTRKYLLEKCELQSIISLPTGVFLPYTGVKTNVIYLKKVNKKVNKKSLLEF
jgi:type I restriction enzyme M protein